MINRHLQTIFCDDIRQEVSGKVSYIGVYSSYLFLKEFPVTLARLCVAVKVVTPVTQPFEALTIRILKDETVIQEVTLSDDQIAQGNEATTTTEDDNQKCLTSHVTTAFSPIQFDAPCILRVRAQTEGEELKGLGLKVEVGPVP